MSFVPNAMNSNTYVEMLYCRTIWLLLVVRDTVAMTCGFPGLLCLKLIDSERAKCFDSLRYSDACDSRFQVYHSELCLDTPCSYVCIYSRKDVVFRCGSFFTISGSKDQIYVACYALLGNI